MDMKKLIELTSLSSSGYSKFVEIDKKFNKGCFWFS